MGLRIIEDTEDGYAVFYCSSSMWAFGPVFTDREEAEAFLEWYGKGTDLRLLTDVMFDHYVSKFRLERKDWEAEKAAAEEAEDEDEGFRAF